MSCLQHNKASLGPDSPEFIDQVIFWDPIGDPKVRDAIWVLSPFSSPADDAHTVFLKTITGVFRMACFYQHFADHPNYFEMIADDLKWHPKVVRVLTKRIVAGRIDFEERNPTLTPVALFDYRTILDLVDQYRHCLRHIRFRRYPTTANRLQYINATRKVWTQKLAQDPQSLVEKPPQLPPMPPVDWIPGSVLKPSSIHTQQPSLDVGKEQEYRTQSPSTNLEADHQIPVRKMQKQSVEIAPMSSDTRSVNHAMSLTIPDTSAPSSGPPVFSIPELVTATLEQVRQCSTTQGVPAEQKEKIAMIIKALEVAENVAHTAENCSELKFAFSGQEEDI